MEYNTSLPHLIIPEYGRNVQKMVQSIIKIEDREKRNHQAKAIIEVMGNHKNLESCFHFKKSLKTKSKNIMRTSAAKNR